MGDQSLAERKALVSRLYKKFPHLFKKKHKPQNPNIFSLRLSATRDEIDEAFELLRSRGDHSDLDGFKKLFVFYSRKGSGATATKSVAADPLVSQISDEFEDAILKHKAEYKELIAAEKEPKTMVGAIFSDDTEDSDAVNTPPVSRISDGFEDAIVTELIATLTEPTTTIDKILTDDKKNESMMFYFGDDYGNLREFAELVKEVISGYASHLTVRSRPFKRCKLSSLDEMLKEFAKENLF